MKKQNFMAIIMLTIAIISLTTASATEVVIQGKVMYLDDGINQTEFSSSSGENTADGIVGQPGDLTGVLSYSQESLVAPIVSEFESDETTTNFSAEDNLTDVKNLTLAKTGKGKIKFGDDYGINSDGENYDIHIEIGEKVIFVNSSALHPSFNNSATLTFQNVDCNNPYVFYSETASQFEKILSENQRCFEPLCSNIQCNSNTLTVDVLHFTGYAAGTNANLTIEAEAGVKYANDPIEFTAEYINSTSGTPISGECNITFDDDWGTWYTMDFDSTDYNYTKSSGFAIAGIHHYNVTCAGSGYVNLMANDTKEITGIDIPEFNIFTLGFGLLAVLVAIIILRRKL